MQNVSGTKITIRGKVINLDTVRRLEKLGYVVVLIITE